MVATTNLTEPERGIWLLKMMRGAEMNTLTHELIDDLNRAIDACDEKAARALIITGSAGAFCCGAHLKYFAGAEARFTDPLSARNEYLARIASTFDRLEECAYPTIAAINGYALGGGFELALSCDLRVMAHEATVGLPETRLGAVAAAGGVQKLIRHVGRARALEWTLLARHIDSATAERSGLVAALAPRDELIAKAVELARELRRLGPAALEQTKKTIYASEDADLRTARRYGIDALCLLVGGREWQEGMEAFVQKRPPRFDEW